MSMLICFVLILQALLRGKNVALLNPKGLIAQQQHNLLVFSVILLLTIAIPTLIFLYSTAWKYRDSSPRAIHNPANNRSKLLVLSMWLLPTIFMLILASVMIPATHKLSPQKTIATDTEPLTIQVISLRWKWLFIYPDQKIATINFVQVPINTPVTFELTADETPMSSFWIPNIGGQLYSMTGHVNRLNLMAEKAGDYTGSTAEINGAGFAGMRFTTRASNNEDFDHWVEEVKKSPDILDNDTYSNLLKPSENNKTAFYSNYKGDLYDKVVMKYSEPSEGHMHHE